MLDAVTAAPWAKVRGGAWLDLGTALAMEKAKGVPLLEWEMAPASVGAKADLSALASGEESWTG